MVHKISTRGVQSNAQRENMENRKVEQRNKIAMDNVLQENLVTKQEKTQATPLVHINALVEHMGTYQGRRTARRLVIKSARLVNMEPGNKKQAKLTHVLTVLVENMGNNPQEKMRMPSVQNVHVVCTETQQ